MNNNFVILAFGYKTAPIEDQLNGYGLTLGDKAEYIEKNVKAHDYLYGNGYLTERESDRVLDRIMNDIQKTRKPIENKEAEK